MAEKIKINVSNGQKKSSDEQFLKASRNWEKCSALVGVYPLYTVNTPYSLNTYYNGPIEALLKKNLTKIKYVRISNI
jgi:hypothetical protein